MYVLDRREKKYDHGDDGDAPIEPGGLGQTLLGQRSRPLLEGRSP